MSLFNYLILIFIHLFFPHLALIRKHHINFLVYYSSLHISQYNMKSFSSQLRELDIIIYLSLLLNNSISRVLLFYLNRTSDSLREALQRLALAAFVGLASWLQLAVVVDRLERQRTAHPSVQDLVQALKKTKRIPTFLPVKGMRAVFLPGSRLAYPK